MAAEKPSHTPPHTQSHTTPPKPPATLGQVMQENLRNGVMVILTFLFVAVYIGALLGLIPGTAKQDPQTLSRIETILFVIIGYYFGRLPVAATEKTLKDEIHRQAGKADNAEQAKTEALQEKQGLQEKVKNARAALTAAIPEAAPDGLPLNLGRGAASADSGDALHHSVTAAIRVLDS